jgi:hypothetical protein
MFSVKVYMLRQTLFRLAPPCPFHLPFAFSCDVAQARSHFASTVQTSFVLLPVFQCPFPQILRRIVLLFNAILWMSLRYFSVHLVVVAEVTLYSRSSGSSADRCRLPLSSEVAAECLRTHSVVYPYPFKHLNNVVQWSKEWTWCAVTLLVIVSETNNKRLVSRCTK